MTAQRVVMVVDMQNGVFRHAASGARALRRAN